MEQKQTFKGDQFSGSGHTYAKQKFESKNEFDKAKGRTSGGPSFKNPFSKFVLPAVSNMQRMPTSLNGYVPQGLSEAEYKAAKNAEDAKKAQNKQRFPKGKATLDIADWLKQMEQKQTFNGDKFSGSGHTYAKQKFGSKSEFDEANGRTSGSSIFKNPFSKFVLPAVSNVKHGNGPDALSSHHNSPAEYSPATDEQQAAQKLLANTSNMPMTLSAIGVALFSLATMLGARLWRQTPASGDNNMELPAGGSARREFIATVAGAAGAAVATPALADTDYAGLPYLGGSSKIDINNANVRVYAKLPGMYPGAAGKICSNGPYKSVSDLYNIKGISEAEKAAIKKYESRLIVLEPSAMYVIDRLNNGLYR